MAPVTLGDVTNHFWAPAHSLIGPGASKEVGSAAQGLGVTHALLVTDKTMVKLGLMEQIKGYLEAAGLKVTVFDAVDPDPTDKNVAAGLELYQKSGCNGLVSLGGGSPQDCAKAIGVVATNGGNFRDYAGPDKVNKPLPPLVALNTTAGTGSETTRSSVITNTDLNVKTPIVSARCIPAVAINDPRLMAGMPPGLTAATGMDALTHAVECYVSLLATPLTDALALGAIKLIGRWLRPAVANGGNLEARDKMAYAELIAGMAFTNGRLGCAHSVAHQLGTRCGIHHGVGCAVMLPYVCQYNLIAAPERFAEVAAALGEDTYGLTPMEAAAKAPAAIHKLNNDVGIPATLAELGVKESDIEWLNRNATNDGCNKTNPRQPITSDVMLSIIRMAFGTALAKGARV